MNTVAVLAPVALDRWPDGVRQRMPCLVTVLCPFCGDEHSHGINAAALLDKYTWTCDASRLLSGRYRIALKGEVPT